MKQSDFSWSQWPPVLGVWGDHSKQYLTNLSNGSKLWHNLFRLVYQLMAGTSPTRAKLKCHDHFPHNNGIKIASNVFAHAIIWFRFANWVFKQIANFRPSGRWPTTQSSPATVAHNSIKTLSMHHKWMAVRMTCWYNQIYVASSMKLIVSKVIRFLRLIQFGNVVLWAPMTCVMMSLRFFSDIVVLLYAVVGYPIISECEKWRVHCNCLKVIHVPHKEPSPCRIKVSMGNICSVRLL